MKPYACLFSLVVALHAGFCAEPAGEFIELHSCDLYTGGCTASSESTLLGRQLLRVWSIDQGVWNSQDLTGLKVALLEVGSENLAEKGTLAEKAEIFVPKALPPAQKTALVSWVAAQGAIPVSTPAVETDITYRRSGQEVAVAVGDTAFLSTVGLEKCSSGACGQALWYEPQVNHTSFTVVASRVSKIRDARLSLLWTDHDRPDVFLATFGPSESKRQLADSSCR